MYRVAILVSLFLAGCGCSPKPASTTPEPAAAEATEPTDPTEATEPAEGSSCYDECMAETGDDDQCSSDCTGSDATSCFDRCMDAMGGDEDGCHDNCGE
jgi:hypothetical protein